MKNKTNHIADYIRKRSVTSSFCRVKTGIFEYSRQKIAKKCRINTIKAFSIKKAASKCAGQVGKQLFLQIVSRLEKAIDNDELLVYNHS